jgi:3-hydroxyacyl-[acyl-carrier-protein] dehydratase
VNRAEIQQFIPHRAPFLWLDEVVEITEETIHARSMLDPGLELFGGHFPSFPILPGVIQCEMALQAAAVFIAKRQPSGQNQIPVATRMNNVKFRRMVRPGEMVDIKVELTDRVSNAFFFTGHLSVEGATATRLDFACTMSIASGANATETDATA